MTGEWYSFWPWVLKGTGERPGWRRAFSWWNLADIAFGLAFALLVQKDLSSLSASILIPLSGVFIGLASSVSSSSQSLLISDELFELAIKKVGGMADYVFPFNLAILFILSSMSFWSIAATELLDGYVIHICSLKFQPFAAFGFLIASLSIRLTWSCLIGSSHLIFAIHEVRRSKKN